jgi:hypothetical protein
MVQDDAVLQEAAQLHGFVESVIHLCADLREDYPVFSKASLSYFAYIVELGKKTQAYLEGFPAFYRKSTDVRAASSKLQKLYSLKTSWEALHAYIKPALDADTLHLPSSLITAFEDIVNTVPDWQDYRFVLFHTTEANYLQVPSGMAREVANDIADSVNCERFDANLGLVGIPYSQPNSIFLNCVLPHEFSHFIYQEFCDDEVQDQIDISTALLNHLKDDDLSWCLAQIKLWVEETFCDLMAICMIGPAFSIALVRLVAATSLVDRPDGEPADAYAFKDGYPADVARLHFHKKMLERLGWWPMVSGWDCSPVKALIKCSTWSPLLNIEGWVPPGTAGQMLTAFQEICEWLLAYCSGFFPNVSVSVANFDLQAPEITKYLKRAIVPSTILVDDKEQYPDPVVLLNAGIRFLSQDISALISGIAGQDPSSVETHSKIAARVELWILKAIEDNRLLTRQEN